MRTGRQLCEEARRAAEALGALPPRLQLGRLGESRRLLDAVTLAVALGLAHPSTVRVVQSPRLGAERFGSLLRVRAAVAAVTPPRARATHWGVRAAAELRRQLVEVQPMAPRVTGARADARGPWSSPGWESPAAAPALPPR